jgi:hypothetical protein
MDRSQREREDAKADWLGLMLVECSFAYLGWSYAKNESKSY